MSRRNWFDVGVRLIGLWQIVTALDEFVTYGNAAMRLYTPSYTNPRAFLTHALARLLVGFFLLFSAVSVVNAVYPADGNDDPGPPAGE